MNLNDPLNDIRLSRAVGSLGAYPYGIGPVNRTMSVGLDLGAINSAATTRAAPIIAQGIGRVSSVGSVTDYVPDWVKTWVTEYMGDLVRNQLQFAKVMYLRYVMGYVAADPKIVSIGGKSYVLLKNSLGVVKKIGPDGDESDYSPQDQSGSTTTGTGAGTGSGSSTWASPTNIGLIAAVAAVGLFFFLRRR
jgi:hypothetical protein